MSIKNHIKEQSKKVKQIAKKYGYEIKHSHALEITSQLMGDNNWHVSCSDKNDLGNYSIRLEKLSTGDKALDEKLGGGLKRGNLTAITGSTGSGKTEACIDISCSAIKDKGPYGLNLSNKVFHTNLELSRTGTIMRYISKLSNVNHKKLIDSSLLENKDKDMLDKATKKYKQNLLVRNLLGGNPSFDDFKNIIKEQRKSFDYDILVVDTPTLLEAADAPKLSQEIVIRNLMYLAKVFDIFVLATIPKYKNLSIPSYVIDEDIHLLEVMNKKDGYSINLLKEEK